MATLAMLTVRQRPTSDLAGGLRTASGEPILCWRCGGVTLFACRILRCTSQLRTKSNTANVIQSGGVTLAMSLRILAGGLQTPPAQKTWQTGKLNFFSNAS